MAVSEDQNQQETNHPIDEGELEQYGVWVKAGPEDVIEAEAEDEAFSLADLSEDELTEAGTDLLSDEGVSLEVPPESQGVEDLDLGEDLGFDDELEEVAINDDSESLELDSLEPDTGDEPDVAAGVDPAELAISGDDKELVELTLDDTASGVEETDDELETLDLDMGEPAASPELADEELLSLDEEELTPGIETESEELGIDLSDSVAEEPDVIPAEPVDGLDDLDLGEDLELEDLGESSPAPSPPADESGDGVIDDNLSIDEDLPEDLNDLTLDLDDLDVDSFEEAEPAETVEDLDEAGAVTADIAPEEPPALDEPDDSMDLSTLQDAEGGFTDITDDELTQADEGELPELSPDDEMDLGDAEDLGEEDDLLADLGTAAEREAAEERETVAAQTTAADDRSLSLLESIERELSSIRSELGDLKRELGELRSVPQPVSEAPADDDETSGGFFDAEDDDETISLTGDEMANIMNTAEFTEETGEPTEFDDLPGPPEPAGEGGIELSDEGASDEVDEISLGLPEDETVPLELDVESSTEDALGGSPDEVEALAGIDIDAELADIDDLEDSTESMPAIEAELPDLDLGVETPVDEAPEEVVLDAEPLDVEPPLEAGQPDELSIGGDAETMPDNLKTEMKTVLQYLDQLLEALPEDKITEFAKSEHFTVYQRLFEELGLEQ